METPPTIEFPCDYPVKVIGEDSEAFTAEVMAVAAAHDPTFTADRCSARKSAKGNYVSVTVTLHATGEEQLTALFQDLKQISGIRMVL